MTHAQGPNGSGWQSLVEGLRTAAGAAERARLLEQGQQEPDEELATVLEGEARTALRRDPRFAEHVARLGEQVALAVGCPEIRVRCLRTAAEAGILGGSFTSALAAADEALALLPPAAPGRDRAELSALRLQCLVHGECFDEADRVGEEVLAAFRKCGHRAGELQVLMALADLDFRLDRPRAALVRYHEVERLLPETVPPRVRAIVATNRANALEARYRFRAARRHFERARTLFALEGCDHTVAQVDYNVAYSEFLRGRYEDALRHYGQVEEVFRDLGDERHLAHVDLDRAEVYLHLNLPGDAKTHASAAGLRFDALGLAKERAQAQFLGACADHVAGRSEDAAQGYEDAGEAFAGAGLTERRLATLVQRAHLALEAGRVEEAAELADGAEALADGSMSPVAALGVDLVQAAAALEREQLVRAAARIGVVIDGCRRLHAPWLRVQALRLSGRCAIAQRDVPAAIAAYREAVDVLEDYRGGVPPDEYMAAFLAGRAKLYEEVVDILVRAREVEEAFGFTERAKSRALTDLLGNGLREKAQDSGDDILGARLSHLQEQLHAVYQRLFKRDARTDARSVRAAREARQRAGSLEREIGRLLRDRRLASGGERSLAPAAAPAPSQVQQALEPGTVLLEYLLTEDELFTFVVTRDDLHVVRQSTSQGKIRDALAMFRFHVTKQEHGRVKAPELALRATRANLTKLARLLLDPVAEHLDAERLVVVPHGMLHYVPFHALPWGEGWVAEHFEVVYAPSAAVYLHCGNAPARAQGDSAVFGLPDEVAPRIDDEARAVARHLGTQRLFLHEEATLTRLRQEAVSARVLHIATHGMFSTARPMLSSIRLADRWVHLYDLYELEVRSELVVLSTCESGIADVTDGDEILGLTRGFLFAGATALLTSQWRVSDAVTATFMDAFYRAHGELDDVAAAYRRAMDEVRAKHPHPYHWAPFFLTGRPSRQAKPEVRSGSTQSGCLVGTR